MAVFAYKGLDARGKQVDGVKEGENARVLRGALRREGIFVTELSEERERVVSGKGLSREVDIKGVFDRVKPQDVAVITRLLATLLKAGIPLAESLGALVEQSGSDKMKRTLAEIRINVNEGMSLADSLAEHPTVFSDVYVNMVRAGEEAGNLEMVLVRLTEFLDGQVRLRGKIQGAMLYPIIMLVVMTGIIALLMTVVVPKITAIFDDMGKALPWNTQLLVFVSKLTGSYWWLMAILGVAAYFGFRYWRKTPKGKPIWDRFVLRLWLVGPLVRMIAVGRFARVLGTLLTGGVPLLRSLEIVKFLLGNDVLIKVVDEARVAIREGESIAAPLAKSGQFPPVVTRMIAVGERSGHLEEMLENVAIAYENETELRLERLTSMLGPLLILSMGLIVAFVVFSMLMPILQMNEMIGG